MTASKLIALIEDAGFSPRRCSGRTMMGKECISFTCEKPIAAAAIDPQLAARLRELGIELKIHIDTVSQQIDARFTALEEDSPSIYLTVTVEPNIGTNPKREREKAMTPFQQRYDNRRLTENIESFTKDFMDIIAGIKALQPENVIQPPSDDELWRTFCKWVEKSPRLEDVEMVHRRSVPDRFSRIEFVVRFVENRHYWFAEQTDRVINFKSSHYRLSPALDEFKAHFDWSD